MANGRDLSLLTPLPCDSFPGVSYRFLSSYYSGINLAPQTSVQSVRGSSATLGQEAAATAGNTQVLSTMTVRHVHVHT